MASSVVVGGGAAATPAAVAAVVVVVLSFLILEFWAFPRCSCKVWSCMMKCI